MVSLLVVPLHLTFNRGVLSQDFRDGGFPRHGPGYRDQKVVHSVQDLQDQSGSLIHLMTEQNPYSKDNYYAYIVFLMSNMVNNHFK